MNSKTKICVIGAGIAGLSASVFLAQKGFKVTLIEASNKAGGRATSFFDDNFGRYIDNGQHLLASWYTSTFEFLKIIGCFEKLYIQDGLEIEFRNLVNRKYILKFSHSKPPLNILNGLLKYKALRLTDLFAVKRLINFINSSSNGMLIGLDSEQLLAKTRQSQNITENFWKPFIISAFNAKPSDTSASMFVNMIRLGFLEKNMSNLAIPKHSLYEFYVKPSLEYLKKSGVNIITPGRVTSLNITHEFISSLTLNKSIDMIFDYYVLAIPYYEYKNIFPDNIFENNFKNTLYLKPSVIINIHHKITVNPNEIKLDNFFGVLNGKLQWIFKTNSDDKELSLCSVISAANEFANTDNEILIRISRDEIRNLIPELKDAKFEYSKVIKEKRATFLPDNESASYRLDIKTKYRNLFLTGDWIKSELPATLETAVRNSKKCVELLTEQVSSN